MCTYNPPILSRNATVNLSVVGIVEFRSIIKGKNRIMKSVIMVATEFACQSTLMSRHMPPGIVLSQKYARGRHGYIVVPLWTNPSTIMPPNVQLTTRLATSSAPETRRYWRRMEIFVKMTPSVYIKTLM
jgi:hypothetical protein